MNNILISDISALEVEICSECGAEFLTEATNTKGKDRQITDWLYASLFELIGENEFGVIEWELSCDAGYCMLILPCNGYESACYFRWEVRQSYRDLKISSDALFDMLRECDVTLNKHDGDWCFLGGHFRSIAAAARSCLDFVARTQGMNLEDFTAKHFPDIAAIKRAISDATAEGGTVTI